MVSEKKIKSERYRDKQLLSHFQQYFSYIVGVNFISGENRRKTSTTMTTLVDRG
jgi:hypothetical protein